MSKKKRSTPRAKDASYNNNPFKQLKGFAVSDPETEAPPEPSPAEPPAVEAERSFAAEMEFLGVDPLSDRDGSLRAAPPAAPAPPEITPDPSDEELFLGSLGQLDARFSDRLPQQLKPAAPRRLKQLKLGRLTPDASLDLHGLQRHQVAEKLEHFLDDAVYQRWQTLLIITGRGLHSPDGEPVLRDAVEQYLADAGKSLIAEWGRAPRQYGGEGALVVFLKKTTPEI